MTDNSNGERKPLRTLANGSVYDMETHRIVKGPTNPIINSDNAAQFQARARELRERKARAEVVRATEEYTGKTGLKPTDAYAIMAGEFQKSALVNALDKPRDAVHAAKLVLGMAGMAPAEAAHDTSGPVIRIELRAQALEAVKRLWPGEVIDGEARELPE